MSSIVNGSGGASHLPSLAVRGLTKSFAGRTVLTALDLQVMPGEVRALLGENGSGKSTFIKILSGFHLPDSGHIEIDGRRLQFGSSRSALELGCRFVHQDLGLVPSLSVLDNLFVGGGYPTRFGTISGRAALKVARSQLERVGLDVDPRCRLEDLSPARQTGVALARALGRDTDEHAARFVILDEPTATLPAQDVTELLSLVRSIADRGLGVLYVTHRLDEVFDIAHKVTVLRDGREVATRPVAELDHKSVINLLVGAELEEVHAMATSIRADADTALLEVNGLEAGVVRDVSFTASAGEILGIAGITGSGRETLLSAVFGARPRTAGRVMADGRVVRDSDVSHTIRQGVAYLPPDRKVQGGFLDQTARENLTIADLRPFKRGQTIWRRPEVREARRWFSELGVRPANGSEAKLSTFSGGNQQKIMFGKWLRTNPKVLLFDEPTQGVDVGAKAELHKQLIQAAGDGAAVIVSSSDADELANLCHRVLVMSNGRIAASLSGPNISVSDISRTSLGTE